MKHLTIATLAVLVSAGSMLAFSPNANAQNRQEYCTDHQCGNYNRDRHSNRNDTNYTRRSYYRNYYGRDNNKHRERWYDSRTHTWHYRYR